MAGSIPEYDELKLRVRPRDEGGYDVEAFAPDGGTAMSQFTSPVSELELDNFILRVARPRSGVRAFRSSHMEEAKQLGSDLFEHLLADDVGDLFHRARAVADSKGRGLRISLSMTKAPELLEIPWELLYDTDDAYFLSQSIYTPVVRSLDLKNPPAPREVTLPLRVLALVSSPQGFAELDTAAEREKLESALAPLIQSGTLELEWLDPASLAELNDRLAAPDEIHVMHYIGHGAYAERAETGVVVLEDAQGRPHEVTGEEFASCMRDEKSLRLVVLNACEGARASHVDPFSGVASSLLRGGLPAVIGMQTEITDEAAITFSDRFYTALVQGFPIDAALAQARRAIFAAGKDVEFSTPVLFMRVLDGRIFEVSGEAPPPPVGRIEPQVEAEPPTVAPGGTVTWRVRIRNAGSTALSDVVARDKSGDTRAGPLRIEAGVTHEASWTAPAESDVEECVTVGGRGSDGRQVSAQASAHVRVEQPAVVGDGGPPEGDGRGRDDGDGGGGGWRPSPRLLIGAGVVALAAVLALLLFGGGDDQKNDFKPYRVGNDVHDMDVRGDKLVFLAVSPIGNFTVLKRLDLATGKAENVDVDSGRFNGMDVGIDAAGHERLVYSRCDPNEMCKVFSKSFGGPERAMAESDGLCEDIRPSMWRGITLFARQRGICQPEMFLKPSGGADRKSIAGATRGADLNDGFAVWLTPAGALEAQRVTPNAAVKPGGLLEPAGGDVFGTPIVVDDGWVYFVHDHRSKHFVARTSLPLGSADIEHYSAREGDRGTEAAPHFGVSDGTLYLTDYPQPNGESGSRTIVRVRNPDFQPLE